MSNNYDSNKFSKLLEHDFLVRNILTIVILSLMLVKSVQYLVSRHKRKAFPKKATDNAKRKQCTHILGDVETDNTYKSYYSLPGPKPFPIRFIGNAFSLFKTTDMIETVLDISRKYGECIRLVLFGEDYVLLNSPQTVQALLASNDTGHFTRGAFQEKLRPEGLHSLMYLPGDAWKTRRKMLNRSFTYKSLQKYNSSFNKHADKLVLELEHLFSDAQVHTINKLVTHCVFRSTSETLMGVEISDNEAEIFCESAETFLNTIFQRLYRPWLYPKWAWNLHSLSRKMEQLMKIMSQIAYKVIKKHSENIDSKNFDPNYQDQGYDSDELESISSSVTGNVIEVMLHHGVSAENIFHEVATFLGIAQDATSISILYALFLLALNPHHQAMCRNEVDAILNDSTKNTNGNIDFHKLSDLKHLERCIHESQRLYPIASTTRKLETPLRINEELVIPAGVTAVYLAHTLHYNPKYFPNPEIYDPDRFLPDQVKKRHPYSFLPYSAGARNCIGKKLGLIDMKVILAKILYNFEIFTTDRKEDLKLNYNGIPKPIKPIKFIFRKRCL